MALKTLQDLRQHVQWAIDLEHFTLPPYLCALYSIKAGTNTEATHVILSVFMEEMLHLTLAANLLNAIGGEPKIDTPAIMPTYPAYFPHSDQAFQVPLLKFSPEAIDVFLQIERPAESSGTGQDDVYSTLGEFYTALEAGLIRLCEELGEATVFCGDRSRQITDAMYYGGSGRIVEVYDLASALVALQEIIDQGEGLAHESIWDGDTDMFHPERNEVGHYFRYNQLAQGRRYQEGDTAQSGPTGEAVVVDWDAVYNMKPNPRSADYPEGSAIRVQLDEFNHAYCGALHLLEETFNGSPNLLRVATGAMYGLRELAIGLMQLPTGDGDTTVGPSFEYIAPALRHLAGASSKKITVVPNGPYLVYGDVPLVRKQKVITEAGVSLTWRKTETLAAEETYALCRCGRSNAKPFCDGTHAMIRFDGREGADTGLNADRAKVVPGSATSDTVPAAAGSGLVVKKDSALCMGSGFCAARMQKIPDLMAEATDSDMRSRIIGMIDRCPSGAYTYAAEVGGPDIEPDLPVAIAVTAASGLSAGPLWVTGGIPVHRADGQPFETRNRVTLCRCGGSKTKPFCDGSHTALKFRDEVDLAARGLLPPVPTA